MQANKVQSAIWMASDQIRGQEIYAKKPMSMGNRCGKCLTVTAGRLFTTIAKLSIYVASSVAECSGC